MSEAETLSLDQVTKRYGVEFQQRPLPTDADVAAVVTERVTTLLEARLRERDTLKTERSQRFVALARRLGENEDGSALIAMLLDDYYQQPLHAMPPQPAERSQPVAKPASKSDSSRRRPRRGRRPGHRHHS